MSDEHSTECCGDHGEHGTAAESKAKPGQYTCPMHPEVVADLPGDCPICGMALEFVGGASAEADEHAEAEIRSLSRKFWIGLALSIPVFLLAMGAMIPGLHLHEWIPKGIP